MMWAFATVATAELFIVHFLVATLWSGTAAALLSALTLLSILWLIGLIRSFRRLPVLVDGDGLLMRAGTLRALRIDAANVGRVRRSFPSAALKEEGMLNLAMLSYPNVIVELAAPVAGRRGRSVRAVAHALDDPDRFAAAVAPGQAP